MNKHTADSSEAFLGESPEPYNNFSKYLISNCSCNDKNASSSATNSSKTDRHICNNCNSGKTVWYSLKETQ